MSLNNGFYEYVINKLVDEEIQYIKSKNDRYIDIKEIDKEETSSVISKYMAIVLDKALSRISGEDKQSKQIEICNKIINLLIKELKIEDFDEFLINENAKLLLAVINSMDVELIDDYKHKKIRPITSIASDSLFTGAQNEPSLGSELVKEINTADRIDMLVSFIKWSGLVQIIESLKEFTKHKKLRIITTSYMGATDYKAILELSRLPNTEIKISYDTKRTRLHSKSYMFNRNTGFSTAYIGSSNLSNSAITTGLEWNLKISEYTSKDMIKKFNATFDSYWHDQEFYLFNKDDANDSKYFHWQSQSATSDKSPTGQRYINHESTDNKILLFVREKKKTNGITEPYYCLGSAKFVSYEGSKPMSIKWKLDNKMPAFIKKKASGNIMVG